MAEEIGPIVVPESVTETATQDAEPEPTAEPGKSAKNGKPVLLSLEELKQRAAYAASPEGRMEHAEKMWVDSLGAHVMVAPARGLSMYEQIFARQSAGESLTGEDANPSIEFMREIILNCVVAPELDEEAVRLIADANAKDFANLAAMCLLVSQKDAEMDMDDILGVVRTEAKERFFVERDGSTSTPTLA